ncbi:MAG: hypothetical protein CMG00_02455 [Candidatus Marinimicrobia bacterium]|nr:hypothetical protein [Candidatus Neomarinimicrobiota bacterium]
MKDLKENNKKKKKYIVKGFLFILPATLTFWIVYKIIFLISSVMPYKWIYEIFIRFEIPKVYIDYFYIIIGFLFTLVLLYILGFFVSIFGKKYYQKIESYVFYNIPFFNTIYKTIKQITETISNSDSESFKKVVMVEFPRKGVWTIGFVTGESKSRKGDDFYHVIVPTTPNPTSAYLLFVPKIEVQDTGISVDEGFKAIISGGVLTSDLNHIP